MRVGTPSIRDAIRVVCVLAVLLSAILLLVAGGVKGATAHHLVQIKSDDDAFLNYDFLEEDHSAKKVDWAIDLLFWNNSNVNSVGDALGPWFFWTGSPMHAYFNNGAGWKWDSNKGRKEFLCTAVGDNVHFRIYGPPSDRFYNQRWGFYNIASAHIDHNECAEVPWIGVSVDKWSGESEVAESIVARVFRFVFGEDAVREDVLNFENFQKHENEGSHHWENDAFATKLKMPERSENHGAS